METTPAAAARAPFFEPDPVKEKKRAHSTGVRIQELSDEDDEEEDSSASLPETEEDSMDSMETVGSLSDSWDSDIEWDEEKLALANERKYWNR